MTIDMTAVIQPKSDQINADDLASGPMTVTITKVSIAPGTEQPVAMSIKGTAKVYRPCKTMARAMVQMWGADASLYAGRSLTIYRDPKVKWGGLEVGGIRISHMSHIEGEKTLLVTISKAQRAPMKIRPLVAEVAPTATQAPDNALQLAQDAARKGKAAFAAWWKSDDGRACRAVAEANIDNLKSLVDEADAQSDDGPPI